MSLPEPSCPTTASPEYPNTAEAQENDLKTNSMMMLDVLKEEMKNSRKEIEKQPKSWRKSANPLKNAKKTMKQTHTQVKEPSGTDLGPLH